MINSSSVGKSFNLTQTLQGVVSNTNVNQIRGINTDGSTGSGIPKQVTNVSATVKNASSGTTSLVTIIFGRDPADKNFSGANVLVSGYQGNPSQVQIASGADSPISFIVNNTGESLSIVVQSYGNGGAAPLQSAPTSGVKLPTSKAGGFGTTTSISQPAVSGSASPGQLAKFATPATTVTGGDLSGDVTTSGSTATTVNLPGSGPKFWVSEALSGWQPLANTTSFSGTYGCYTGVLQSNGTLTALQPTATEPLGINILTSSTAGNCGGLIPFPGSNKNLFSLGSLRALIFTAKVPVTSNTRVWIGCTPANGGAVLTLQGMQDDAPNVNFVGFRYSTHASDTKWQCITQVKGTSVPTQTIVAESGNHLDTNMHIFEIQYDGTNAVFYIDKQEVGRQSTSNSTTYLPVATCDNIGLANAVQLTVYSERLVVVG